MKVDVTSTQTGQEPEVSEISKDTSRFEKNLSLPTDPPAPSSGGASVAGKSVNAAVNAAQASIKEDLGPEGESAESVVKGQEGLYQKPTEGISYANKDYWTKLYNHISNLDGFDKSIKMQDFIDSSEGDDEYIEEFRKNLIRSTYKKPVDFAIGKNLEEFKSKLYSQEGILDYSKVATGVLEEEFKPAVSKSKLEGQNTFASLAVPSAPATTTENIETERLKSIIDDTTPSIETEEARKAYATISSDREPNPFYKGKKGFGSEDVGTFGDYPTLEEVYQYEDESEEYNDAMKILTMEKVSPVKFGDKNYAENHDPLVAFGLTKDVLYKKTKAQDDLMLQMEDSETLIDELNTIINNKAWSEAKYLNPYLKNELGIRGVDPDKTSERSMALNPNTGDFYNLEGEELKEGYEEVMMTGNEMRLRRAILKEEKKLASARRQTSNLAFGGSVESAGEGAEGKEKYSDIKVRMKQDRESNPELSTKLDEYEESYRSSKFEGTSERTERLKKQLLKKGVKDGYIDTPRGLILRKDAVDPRTEEEIEESKRFSDYITLIENKIDREFKADESRRKLKEDPSYVKTFDGYYAYVNKLTEDMGEALVPWQREYNENSFAKVKNNIESFNESLYEQKKSEFNRVNKNIEAQYQPQYDKVSDTNPEAIAVTEKYKALYADAVTDEEKAEVHSAYNEELMAIPIMSAIAKQHKQAIDLVQNSLEDKYTKASRDHFGSVMKTQTEAYQRDASNYVKDRFIVPVNEDIGVKSFIHEEMEINPDFNNLSFRDKKKAIDVLWGKWKKIVASQHNPERKKIPLNRAEASLPPYKWTGTTESTREGYDYATGKNFGGFKGPHIFERTGDEGYREFLFHAMSSTMFEGVTQEASVFQVKSWAEGLEKEVDLEVKRLEKEQNTILELPEKYEKTESGARSYIGQLTTREDNAYSQSAPAKKKKEDLIKLKEAIDEIVSHPEQDEDWFTEFYSGVLGGDLEEYVPFVATLVDIDKNASLYNISEKMQNDKPLSFQERVLMDSYSGLQKINELRPRSRAYRVGSMVKDMVPYVGEFALTMGTFTAGKSITKKALTASFKKSIDKTVKKQILLANTGKGLAAGWKGMGREAVTLMGEKMVDGLSYSMGALAQATANPQMTINHIIERMTPESQFMLSGNGEEIYTQITGKGEDFGEAFFKAYGMTFSEMFSEQLGMHLMKLPKGAMKSLAGNPEWLKRTMIGGWMRSKKFVNQSDAMKYIIQNRLGWSGFMGEYLEEFVNGRMSALITGDRGVFDIDASEELDTFLTVALGGTHLSIASIASAKAKDIAGVTSVELKADVMDNAGNSSVISEVFKPSTWKAFNKFLGKPGVHPTQLNDMLGTFEDLTKKQRDVLGAIYVKAKGKELVDSENYETIKADLEKTTGREINDQWLRGGFEMPTIEKGAKGEVVESEEGLRENFLTSLSSRDVTEPLDEDVTIEELNKVTEETNEQLKEPTPIKVGSIAQEEVQENVEEEVTPEEEVVETPVEGEQQITEDVEAPKESVEKIKKGTYQDKLSNNYIEKKNGKWVVSTETEGEEVHTAKSLKEAKEWQRNDNIEAGRLEERVEEVTEDVTPKETETKETKTEKETKEEPIGYEEMVEVEPGKFVPKSTLPTEEATEEVEEGVKAKETTEEVTEKINDEGRANIIAWTKSTKESRKEGQKDEKLGAKKKQAINKAFGMVGVGVRNRVAELLGLNPKSRRGNDKLLNSLASDYVTDNKTLDEFEQAVNQAKAEEKKSTAEAEAIKEKEAPAKSKKAQEELLQKKKDFDAKMREGEEKRKEGDYEGAKQLYNEAIEIDPKRRVEAQEQIDIVSNNTLDTSLEAIKEKGEREGEREKKAKEQKTKIRRQAAWLGIDYATNETFGTTKKKVEDEVGLEYGQEGFDEKVIEKKQERDREIQKTKQTIQDLKDGVLPMDKVNFKNLNEAIKIAQNKVDQGGKPSDVQINKKGRGFGITDQINKAHKENKIDNRQKKLLLERIEKVRENYKEKQAEQKRLEEEGGSLIERKVSEQRRVDGVVDRMLEPMVEKLRKVFPNIEVYYSEQDYEEGVKAAGWSKKRADNNIGFFDRKTNKIYLNPKKASADTAIEEFAHLWTAIARVKAKGVYGTGISLVKGSVYVDEALEEQPELANKDKDGNIIVGKELLHEALGKAIKDGGAKLSTKKGTIGKFKEIVRKIFRAVGRALGINRSINIANTTLEEFASIVQGEILSEKEITSISSEELSPTASFEISNSILAERGFWGKRRSWFNAWFKERKGVDRNLYDKLGKAEGVVKALQRESQDVWNSFQKEYNRYVKNNFPKKVKNITSPENKRKRNDLWNAVGSALNTVDGIEKLPEDEDLRDSVMALKTHISETGDKLLALYKDLGMDITTLQTSFDKKRGIYIHRTYEKHAVANWQDKYTDRFTRSQINDAKRAIQEIYKSDNVKSVEWDLTADNKIELYFTNTKGVKSNDGESVTIDKKNLAKVLGTMFPKKAAETLTEGINNSLKKDGGYRTWTFVKPVKNKLTKEVTFEKSDLEVTQILKGLLDKDNTDASADLSKKMGTTVKKGDLAILRKRKDIPKALRVLYGEYTDPYINFTKTTQRINNLLIKTELEAELLRQGDGSLFTDVADDVTNSVQITESQSQQLKGKWTTPEMHALLFDKDGGLIEMFSPNFVAKAEYRNVKNSAVPALYKILNAQTKASLTVMNPSGQSRNFVSAILFLAQTGRLPTHLMQAVRMVKADMTASELITGSIMNPYLGALSAITWGQDVVYGKVEGWNQPEKQTKEAIRKKLIKAAENRLLDESVQGGIIDELVDKIYTGGSGVSVAEKVKISTIKGYSNFIKAFSKPYQSTDAIFKISQWESEMKSQDKIYGTDRTQEEKEAEATRRVRGEQPTYSEQASIFRALSKNIFLSTFISFDVQTWRNRYNIMSNAGKLRREAAETKELANQYKRRGDTANYEKYKKRAKRLTVAAGVKLGAFALSGIALKLVAMAFASSAGMDGDDEDNISLASDPWYSKNITKIWTSGNKKNTKFYDFSYIDPWSNFWKPVSAAARGDGALDGILDALEEVTSPYLAKEVLWGKVEESIAGIDEQGNELSNEEMSFPNRIGRPLFHALSALEPGVWRDSKAIVNDLLFTDPTDHKGSTKKAGVVFWNAVLGMKEKEVDVMKSNSYMRYNQHNKIDVVLSNYRNPKIGETAKYTQDRLDSYWNLMKKQYDALIELGFTHNDVVKSYAYTDKKGKYHSPTSGQNLRKVKMMNLLSQGKKWVLDEEKGDIKLPKKGKKSKYVNIQGAGNKTNISVE